MTSSPLFSSQGFRCQVTFRQEERCIFGTSSWNRRCEPLAAHMLPCHPPQQGNGASTGDAAELYPAVGWQQHFGSSRAAWQQVFTLIIPGIFLHKRRVRRGGIQPGGPPHPASWAILGASAQHPPPCQARLAPCTGMASPWPLWRRPDSAGPFLSDQRLMVALGGTAELGTEG